MNKKVNHLVKSYLLPCYNYCKVPLYHFTVWVSNLKWTKFFIFLVLFALISGQIQQFFMKDIDNNWLKFLTFVFIMIFIGIKVLMNSKIKSDNIATQAINIAEKETLLRQLSEAEIKVMQAQIEPHFLFNTLSAIQYLMQSDIEKSDKMLENLIKYLRYALPNIRENKATNTLQEELIHIKSYLEIMKIRMGERLEVEYLIDNNLLSILIPSMILQPIVENSIYHGIEPSIEGGKIIISAHLIEDNKLMLMIKDSGIGLNDKNPGNGIALKNIKERLTMLYGNDAQLILSDNNGVEVKVIIPIK